MMGNTFSSPGVGVRWAAAREGRRPKHKPAAGIDAAERDRPVAQHPSPLVGFFISDRFACQHFADKDQLAAPFDLAIGPDTPDGDANGIFRLYQSAALTPGRCCVVAGWRGLAERFMRTLLIVQHGLITPTGPAFASFCIDGIRGL